MSGLRSAEFDCCGVCSCVLIFCFILGELPIGNELEPDTGRKKSGKYQPDY
jgi:hypothetical protein